MTDEKLKILRPHRYAYWMLVQARQYCCWLYTLHAAVDGIRVRNMDTNKIVVKVLRSHENEE